MSPHPIYSVPSALSFSPCSTQPLNVASFIILGFFLFFKTDLLRDNSHIIQFTLFKCSIQWFQCIPRVVQPSSPSNFRTLSSLPKETHTHYQSLPIPLELPSPLPLNTASCSCPIPALGNHYSTLSLFICLFQTFYVNGIILYGLL